MPRSSDVSRMSPGAIQKVTQMAKLVAAEYERNCGDYLTDEDKATLHILSVMTVTNEVINGTNN